MPLQSRGRAPWGLLRLPLSFVGFQTFIFCFTFLSYSAYHAARKGFTNIKADLADQHVFGSSGNTTNFLSLMDFLFLLFYAIGLFASGRLADRYSLRFVITSSLAATSVFAAGFGGLGFLDCSSRPVFGILWAFNGLVQSAGWPVNVAVMANWFGRGQRGAIFGLWAANASVGNIIGSNLIVLTRQITHDQPYSWKAGMVAVGAFVVLVAGLTFLLMPEHPRDVGYTSPTDEAISALQRSDSTGSMCLCAAALLAALAGGFAARRNTSVNEAEAEAEAEGLLAAHGRVAPIDDCYEYSSPSKYMPAQALEPIPEESEIEWEYNHHRLTLSATTVPRANSSSGSTANATVQGKLQRAKSYSAHGGLAPISFRDAWRIPGVLSYSLAYAFLKTVNYAMFFWLPYYLSQGLDIPKTQADSISNYYDYGQIVGVNRHGKRPHVRATVCAAMALLGAACCFGFSRVQKHDNETVEVLMLVAGFLFGGPANLISAAIAADLGQHEQVLGSAEAEATVTGIIDGSGSVGAAFGQLVVGHIDSALGWEAVFVYLMASATCSAIALSRLVLRDVKDIVKSRQVRIPWQMLYRSLP